MSICTRIATPLGLLFLSLASATAQAEPVNRESSAWVIRAELGKAGFRGALLDRRQGAVAAVDFADAFDSNQHYGLALGYQFAAHHEISLTAKLTQADGLRTSFGTRAGASVAGKLSQFQALRSALGYRFYFSGTDQTGAFLGASLGRERRNAVNAELANGAVTTVFARNSASVYGLNAGYQWHFNSGLHLALSAEFERNPALQIAPSASATLGLVGPESEAGWRMPISLQFGYAF